MKAPLTSLKKNHTHSPWGVLAICQVSIFSLVRFHRYRGPKFFCFSNIAATPRDLWHHNYNFKNYTGVVTPMVKILSQFDKWLRRKTLKFCADKKTKKLMKDKFTKQTNSLIEWHLEKQLKVEWHLVEHIPLPGGTVHVLYPTDGLYPSKI